MSSPDLVSRWKSIEATATYMSVSRATIYRLIRQGLIASTHVGTRHLVDLLSVDGYLERNRSTPPPAAMA